MISGQEKQTGWQRPGSGVLLWEEAQHSPVQWAVDQIQILAPPLLPCTKLNDLAQVTILGLIFLICEIGMIIPALPTSHRNGGSEITLKKTTWKIAYVQCRESGRCYHRPSVIYQGYSQCAPSKGGGGEASLEKTLHRLSSSWYFLGLYRDSPGPWRPFLTLLRPLSLASAEDVAEKEADGPLENSLQGATGHCLLSGLARSSWE